LAAEYGALSAEHLEWANDAGIAAMAKSGTVAVLCPAPSMPCAKPSFRRSMSFRKHGVAMALANRQQSRQLAGAVAAADAQHGLHLLPFHAGGGVARRHRQRGEGARPCKTHGTIEAGKAADLVSSTSPGRPSSPIGSAERRPSA
jgi:imidazolonepropionase